MSEIVIVGAGLSGLVAANYFRRQNARIIERQSSLPHNHRALLRFKTDAIGRLANVNFQRVLVRKAVWYNGVLTNRPTLQAANAYSQKVTGEVLNRSLWNLQDEDRYIAPEELVSLLARDVTIEYDRTLTMDDLRDQTSIIISTIPMPALMDIVGWDPKPEFVYRPIWTANLTVEAPPVDVYQTIYYPEASVSYYRASLMGNRLIIEYDREPRQPEKDASEVARHFGLFSPTLSSQASCHMQPYGKIVPIDESIRREFIRAVTWEYGIMSLGRFSTWRQILLDDLPKDLERISMLIDAEVDRRTNQYSFQRPC